MSNITSIATPNNSFKSFKIDGLRMDVKNPRAVSGFLRDLPLEIAIALQENNVTENQKKELEKVIENGSDEQSFGWLVKSILRDGVKSPIKVRFDKISGIGVCHVGNSRLTATRAVNFLYNKGIKTIPGNTFDELATEQEILLEHYRSNQGGVPLKGYELACLIRDIVITFSGDKDLAAKELGIQKVLLENYLSVLSLSEEAQTAIKEGSASVTAVAEIIRETSKELPPTQVLEVVSEAVVAATTAKKGRPKGSTKATKNDIKKVVSKKKPESESKKLELKTDILEYCSDRNNLLEILDSLDQKSLKTIHDILSGN